MKKHLIAAAVAAAVAVPAMAQVTVGGNFDLGYNFGQANKTTKLIGMDTLSTGALTLSGTEDLGGGLKAFFNVNSRFAHAFTVDGDVGSGETANGKAAQRQGTINFGDRGAQIGISGAFGEIALGKTTATAFGGTIRGGIVGNLSLLDESTWGDRPSNMVSYTSPSFGGLSVRYITQTTTSSYELSASYAAGPLNVMVAMNDVKAVAANSSQGNAAVKAGKDTGARASYNFGLAAVNVSYVKLQTIATTLPVTSRDQYSVGLTIPVPQVKGLTLAVEQGNLKTASNENSERRNLSAVYTLSKRTNVYIAMRDDKIDANDRTVAGIRHSF